MPCSICRNTGHNSRTCPNRNPINVVADEINVVADEENNMIHTMILMEKCLRECIIQDKTHQIDDEQLELYESLINTKKKEFKLINLEHHSFKIYIVEGHANFVNFNHPHLVRYLGTIPPRTIMPITSFTGYRYILFNSDKCPNVYFYDDKWIAMQYIKGHQHLCTLDIKSDMQDNININIKDDYITVSELNNKNKTVFSLLKMNFLLKELIRLGGLNNPNFEPILDLHQDIELPPLEPIDYESSGVPSIFTNMN